VSSAPKTPAKPTASAVATPGRRPAVAVPLQAAKRSKPTFDPTSL
jgi:hypothetical protein